MMTDEQEVDECVQADGGLYSLGWYLSYNPGSRLAVLDGEFTARHLRAIADRMEKESP